ncbi:DUF6707 family protein [Pasteurellaceae bacterium LIM206]|nr:DUF6707 family protein [Pasteurellaceae bacterium LIM206]
MLFLNKENQSTEILLETISLIPFEGDYDYWTFIRGSIILLAFIQRSDKDKVIHFKNIILSTLEYGNDFKKKLNKNIHQRFLSGSTLEDFVIRIENSSNELSEMEYRILYLSDLFRLFLFIDDSIFDKEEIISKINEQISVLQSFIDKNGIFSLYPFKSR